MLLPTVFLCSSVIHSHSYSTSFLSLSLLDDPSVCTVQHLGPFQKNRHQNGMFSIAEENMVASEGDWNE